MSYGVDHQGSDPVLLWLWRRLAAVAPIWRLAWEPSYAVGAGLESKKKKKKKKKVGIEISLSVRMFKNIK